MILRGLQYLGGALVPLLIATALQALWVALWWGLLSATK